MQYFAYTDSFRENRIAFKPHLVEWDEKGLVMFLNFTYPLQVSHSEKKDYMVINVKKDDQFHSKETQDKVLNSTE